MAIVGPSYESLFADVGANVRVSDGVVWNKCDFSKALEKQELSIPNPRCLPWGVQRIPFVLIGDDAFRLNTYMMKSYSQQNLITKRRLYNSKHSRAKRTSENMYGMHTGKQMVYLGRSLLIPCSLSD